MAGLRIDDAQAVLKEVFGHDQFRPNQWDVIRGVLGERRDALAVLATGSGKSLMFQFPTAFLRRHKRRQSVTIVISPLLSLISDQLLALRVLDIPAVALSSTSKASDMNAVMNGEAWLVYTTPETALTSTFASAIEAGRSKAGVSVDLIAIDEAHCISEWGVDDSGFRASYAGLGRLRDMFPGVPVLAATATATLRVEADVTRSLGLVDPLRVRASMLRSNLAYDVKPKPAGGDAGAWVMAPLIFRALTSVAADAAGSPPPASPASPGSSPGPGQRRRATVSGSCIVYTLTRNACDAVAATLNARVSRAGICVAAYHAGMGEEQRRSVHEGFLADRIHVVVATVAFAMGIDKPDIRLVLHFGPSKSLAGYAQQTGRAGRDGLPSRCVLFHAPADFTRLSGLIASSAKRQAPSSQATPAGESPAIAELGCMRRFTHGSSCRHRLLIEHFGEEVPPGWACRTACDVCCGGSPPRGAVVRAAPGDDDERSGGDGGAAPPQPEVPLDRLVDARLEVGAICCGLVALGNATPTVLTEFVRGQSSNKTLARQLDRWPALRESPAFGAGLRRGTKPGWAALIAACEPLGLTNSVTKTRDLGRSRGGSYTRAYAVLHPTPVARQIAKVWPTLASAARERELHARAVARAAFRGTEVPPAPELPPSGFAQLEALARWRAPPEILTVARTMHMLLSQKAPLLSPALGQAHGAAAAAAGGGTGAAKAQGALLASGRPTASLAGLRVESLDPAERVLLDELRALRSSLAALRGVPAAYLLSEPTMLAIARERPGTHKEFLRMPGVSGRQADQLAKAVCGLVSDAAARLGLGGRHVRTPVKPASAAAPAGPGSGSATPLAHSPAASARSAGSSVEAAAQALAEAQGQLESAMRLLAARQAKLEEAKRRAPPPGFPPPPSTPVGGWDGRISLGSVRWSHDMPVAFLTEIAGDGEEATARAARAAAARGTAGAADASTSSSGPTGGPRAPKRLRGGARLCGPDDDEWSRPRPPPFRGDVTAPQGSPRPTDTQVIDLEDGDDNACGDDDIDEADMLHAVLAAEQSLAKGSC
ncbi:hypothetical protein FNF27_01276 [Cafeteria roenbergensis]|uniref:DNA 3'-5' helicase n=1 Tax=Cafeteria roenbergensis TaxID=33653 RepID=A0A5A8EIS9_CAFRO|nr:hypothetical protein FNF27_01276 [Cafeteria roenbergensis]